MTAQLKPCVPLHEGSTELFLDNHIIRGEVNDYICWFWQHVVLAYRLNLELQNSLIHLYIEHNQKMMLFS